MYPVIGVDQIANAVGMTVQAFYLFVMVSAVWSTILKGFALWFAARSSQRWWFIALLIVNTLGILELVYLLFFRPKTSPRVDSSQEMR